MGNKIYPDMSTKSDRLHNNTGEMYYQALFAYEYIRKEAKRNRMRMPDSSTQRRIYPLKPAAGDGV